MNHKGGRGDLIIFLWGDITTILDVSFVGNLGSSTWHGGVSDGGYAGICSGSWGGD